MKLWLDTADADELRAVSRFGVISGVTTNPSLWAKAASGTDYREVFVEICSIIDGPISAECVAQDVDGLVQQARNISTMSLTTAIPSWLISSSRPTKGLTKDAPDWAASSAWLGWKMRVVLTLIPSLDTR